MSSTNGSELNASTSRHVPVSYTITNDTPIVALDARSAFEKLTEREQLYAHYLSRASFYGGLICLLQTSPESPGIFRLIHRMNMAQTSEELREACLAKDIPEVDFKSFLVYSSGVYANMGNYKGFGDTKIVPDVLPEMFEKIVTSSKAWSEDEEAMQAIWSAIKGPMFSLSDREKQLGLDDKGVTTYFTPNCTNEDSDLVNRFFKLKNMEGYINRVFKVTKGGENGRDLFEIRHAAAESSVIGERQVFENADFVITAGDYNSLLHKVNENLLKAKDYGANEDEKSMLEFYVQSFREGSLDAHKNGSRHWIKNKGPTVETYIGFIETYRDPVGMRGEFEGFVAMVNKEQSAKFQELVDNAENLLTYLPWPKEFEKDTFLRPDFTSLDVLAFAGSGIPAGINIPNYDEIRQSEGFKNVNLGNVIAAAYKSDKKNPFVSLSDHEMLEKYRVKSFEVQVGLHELLGHGSGKLLRKEADGSLNFPSDLVNPLDGLPVSKMYEPGEGYDSKFTRLGSAYEECRAECVGLYLSTDTDVLKIFGISDSEEMFNHTYTNWFSLLHAAINGIAMYSTTSEEWKQAHSQARFVILSVLVEAEENFVSVKEVTGEDGKPDLLLTMDKSKLESVGKPAIGQFLKKLQVYKSLGDFESADEMFSKHSKVTEQWLQWRDIVIDRKQPRKMKVQANTIIKDEKLTLVDYPSNHDGVFQSWRERWSAEEAKEIDSFLATLTKKDDKHFHC